MSGESDAAVLLVEDNEGDVAHVQRAFEDRDLPGTLYVVRSGTAALDWLFQRQEYADEPRPDLVLLDLNLPGADGHEVLATARSDPSLQTLPIVVLTSSQSEEDVREAYAEHANACVRKPIDPAEFGDRIEATATFWLEVAACPEPAPGGVHDGL